MSHHLPPPQTPTTPPHPLNPHRAVQLEYTEARDCLQQAARKAPGSALGFQIAANKWLIVVRLLLGEIPERSEFSVPGMRAALQPYFELTTAVRSGDLTTFK